MKTSNLKNESAADAATSDDHRSLVPMLISGLVLIVIGMIGVMAFV